MLRILFLSILFTFQEALGVDNLRFFTIGDMGGLDVNPYSTYYERCTAAEMGKVADTFRPQFVLELGDNFYWNGVDSADDFRFNATFEQVYTAESLQIPWYVIAGNHDHHKNVTAQILYSNKSKRWNFPSLYYYKEFDIDGKNSTLGIIFIDTVTLCGPSDDEDMKQPSGPKDKALAEAQWLFIEAKLKENKAKYLFTAGHHPVWATGVHGPTKCLVDRLLPLLSSYGANGHLAGHEHNLEHLRTLDEYGWFTKDFFVSGMANTVDPFVVHKEDVPPGSSLFHYGDLLSRGGFMYSEVTRSNMTVTFINGLGKQLYTAVVKPRF